MYNSFYKHLLEKLSAFAESQSLQIHAQVRDVETYPPGKLSSSLGNDANQVAIRWFEYSC